MQISQACNPCGDPCEPTLAADFVGGVCAECQAQNWSDEYDRLDAECMRRYNKKHGTNYTVELFWIAACNGEIEKETCKGFPRMMDIIKWLEMIEAEAIAEQEYFKNRQPEIFDNENELPF